MRGFCHQAGRQPEPNVDCGVSEPDKTETLFGEESRS